jgi:hypothetical protein
MNRVILAILGVMAALVLAIGVLVIVLVATGGGDDNGSGQTDGQPTEEPTDGDDGGGPAEGELRLLGPEPLTLDPHIAQDADSAVYIVEIFGGLVTLDPDLKIQPDLAAELPTAENGGKTVNADGTPTVGPFPVCQVSHDQRKPRAAFDGANFMLVWADDRTEASEYIYGARVTPVGEVLDPGGFLVVHGAGLVTPRISWNGTNYIVVFGYENGADVYGVWLPPDGVVVGSPFPIAAVPDAVEEHPDVAWDGAFHVVTYDIDVSLQVCAARVAAGSGGPSEAPMCFEPGAGGRRPRVCHGRGTFHLVTHESQLGSPYASYRIMGRRFDTAETPPIPTVSAWGTVVMTLLVLTAGTIVVRSRGMHVRLRAGDVSILDPSLLHSVGSYPDDAEPRCSLSFFAGLVDDHTVVAWS